MLRQSRLVNMSVSAALFFGAGTPLAKWMFRDVTPWMLAGLFYLGSGLGLTIYRLLRGGEPIKFVQTEVLTQTGAQDCQSGQGTDKMQIRPPQQDRTKGNGCHPQDNPMIEVFPEGDPRQ